MNFPGSDSQTERFILSIEEQYKQTHTLNMYLPCPYPSNTRSSLQFVFGSSSITSMPGQVNPVFNNCTVNLMLITFINEETVSIE